MFNNPDTLMLFMQPVLVEEPSPQECLQLLTGLAPRYETFHHVSISQEALATAVAAAHRYGGAQQQVQQHMGH